MRALPAAIAGMNRTHTLTLARRMFAAIAVIAAASAFAEQDDSVAGDHSAASTEPVSQLQQEWPRIEFAHRATELTTEVAADGARAESTDLAPSRHESTPADTSSLIAPAATAVDELAASVAAMVDGESAESDTVPEALLATESDAAVEVIEDEPASADRPEPAGQDEGVEEGGGRETSGVASAVPSAEAPPQVVGGELDVPQLPKARNIDLTEPVVGELQSEVEVLPGIDDDPEAVTGEELVLLGARVEPGTSTRLSWSPHDAFEGISVPTPVLVVNGAKPGPVLCLTGAVHGDELNGIEVIRRVMYDLNASQVSGAVVGVPIVNQLGFRRNSRYLPDRRDLNRYFPGTPDGSSAARIAYSFFQDIVVHCDMLVDVHTGSFHRTNLPQLRADLNNPAVAEFARAFGDMVVLHGEGQPGTLRREAVEIGIPAVTVEAGEPLRIQEDAVSDGVKGIRTLMTSLGMSSRPFFWSRPRPAYYHSYWVRASRGGLLMSSVQLGAQVREGELLGVVVNPITNEQSDIVSPFAGKVIGMALNQVVMPGFAAYHVGVQASEAEMRQVADDTADLAQEPAARPQTDPQSSPGAAADPGLAEPESSEEALHDDIERADIIEQADILEDGMPDAPEHREE